ncbi:MAG: F0F1 ATP synthase subunit epsilon [Oceanisphaera sp.]|uniref:F0F1 ATP synthase subunit epsilon n=1 Tax=Oceanisphaera sp. TaxID=1929979 RepID=UPI003C70C67E
MTQQVKEQGAQSSSQTKAKLLQVELRLPTRALFSGTARKVFATAHNGAFTLLVNHTDFVTALVPSILIVTDETGSELFFAVDEGILIKKDQQVHVAIQRGLQGESLSAINDLVNTHFSAVDEEERVARSALSRLEANIVRRFGDLRKPSL